MTVGRTLFLHVGLPKVGSSTIQAFLAGSWQTLRTHGLVVLGRDLRPYEGNDNGPGPIVEMESIVGALKRGEIGLDAPPVAAFRDCLLRTIERPAVGSAQAFVLSAENLALRPVVSQILEPVVANISTEVILYVRRQDLWLESAWKQWAVKTTDDAFTEWCIGHAEAGHPNLLHEADRWARLVGVDRLRIGILDSTFLGGGDLIEDFSNRIGFTHRPLPRATHENPMIEPRLLGLLHRYRRDLFDGPHDNRLYTLLAAHQTDRADRPPRRLLGEAARAALLKSYRESNAGLVARYFGGVEQRAREYFWLDRPCPDTSLREAVEDDGPGDDRLAEVEAGIVAILRILSRGGDAKPGGL